MFGRSMVIMAAGLALGSVGCGTGDTVKSASPTTPVATARQHPLDPLTTQEYQQVVAALTAAGHVDTTARFPIITLHAPDKAAVTAWGTGGALPPRRAQVIARVKGKTFEGAIDLTGPTVESWTEKSGVETSVLLEEWGDAQTSALANPEMLAALAKRGITDVKQVFCAPLTMGFFDIPEDRGRRLLKVACFDLRRADNNVFAWPIEGLFAIVDLTTKATVRVQDSGPVPFAPDDHNFTEKAVGALRPALKPVTIAVADGGNVTRTGHEVSWQNWRFHYRIDRRQGPILSLVRYADQGRERSILYEAAMSEMFVPYMDPDFGWYSRTYFDMGEYGVGLFLSTLHRGIDCPATAQFDGMVINDDRGAPAETPDVVCIFERNVGDPSWRHSEIVNGSYEGRPAVELVVRTAAQIGNYDYLIDWVFNQAGEIEVRLGATGINALKGVAATSMSSASAADDTRYGMLVAPNLVSINHDHYFSFRLDFDVDGPANRFHEDRYEPVRLPASNPRRGIYRVVPHEPRTDTDARLDAGMMGPAKWRIMSATATNRVGNATSYEVVPLSHFRQLMADDDWALKRAAFTKHDLWVTPFVAGERFAGGDYVFGSRGDDGLAVWSAKRRPITDTDLVVWHTVGMHHLPRAEDIPVMPMVWHGFRLRPFNFFDRNPALDLRSK